MEVTDPNNLIVWQGVPGPWPPLNGEDILVDILNGLLWPPIPVTPSAQVINSWAPGHMPSASDAGRLVKDSGVPRAWCWW